MTTAILTTATNFASGAIIKPATVTPPANALLHLLPRGNALSWVNSGTSGVDPALPQDIEYLPDGVLVGQTRRFDTGVNASMALPRLISLVVYLDPSNGRTIPLLGAVNSNAEQNIRSVSYFPNSAGGIFQVGYLGENASGLESYATINVPYANTNVAGWANFCLLITTERVYAFVRNQAGALQTGAGTSGHGLRNATDDNLMVGGNEELAHVTPWKLGHIFTEEVNYVSADVTYTPRLDATKNLLAPVGIILP